MIRFIIKYIVLLINQKDYEHFLLRMRNLTFRKARVPIYRRMDGGDYSIGCAIFLFVLFCVGNDR